VASSVAQVLPRANAVLLCYRRVGAGVVTCVREDARQLTNRASSPGIVSRQALARGCKVQCKSNHREINVGACLVGRSCRVLLVACYASLKA